MESAGVAAGGGAVEQLLALAKKQVRLEARLRAGAIHWRQAYVHDDQHRRTTFGLAYTKGGGAAAAAAAAAIGLVLVALRLLFGGLSLPWLLSFVRPR